ncbi:MAG TPA: thioredoxin-like domain-containing protein [Chitinophagaceae bacterium]|jgi:thiol-disulfide isomerase/thioredoxin|nr:thioredoxin-like domain-containing protein [Chitinophagaceae bacterium]
MKKVLFPFCLLLAITGFAQKQGYEIKVTFKPFKKQYIYLGHYFGKTYPIIDSVLLNDKSEAVFKGEKKLPGGIYLVGYPNKTGFFEILVDKQQHFSVLADTATIRNGIQVVNSTDNTLFISYQQYMAARGKEITTKQQQLKLAKTKADSTLLLDELGKLDKTVSEYRNDLIRKNPGNILSALLTTMKEPQLTGRLKEPVTKQDSLDAYNFYKLHYWDGVNFWDGRLAYTTFFEEKVDKFFAQLVVPNPDSIILELDRMLAPATINEEMTRFLLVKFTNRYLVQKYMWEDAVFVHLFEKYFAQKEYPWLTPQGRKTITDRAYSLMANIMGTPAAEIYLPDSTGEKRSLYADTADFTLVVFWDPACGHCKEVLPKLDSFYRAKWNAAGLKIYAVAKETDAPKKDWLKFISEHNLTGWTHVYYSKADDNKRIEGGVAGYSQLYDVLTFPTLYLLDKNKGIIAKKLTYEQIDEVLQLKTKGQ